MAKVAAEKIREFRAEAKFQRTSPQKAKLVLDLIKGLRVEQALNTVHFSTKRMAPVVEKVLRSAIQNANYVSQEQGLDVDVDNLYVKTAIANEGPRMKRIRPSPQPRKPPPRSQQPTRSRSKAVLVNLEFCITALRLNRTEHGVKGSYGTESPSVWVSPRHQQAVEVTLVRRARL